MECSQPCGGNDSPWAAAATVAPGRKLCFGSLAGAWTYPLFAHWAWGGGWLAQLGQIGALGSGFVDCGGAGSIHAVVDLLLWPSPGFWAAPGKVHFRGHAAAIPGHNTVLVLFGCWLAWFGWLGLDSAGAILFAGSSPGVQFWLL